MRRRSALQFLAAASLPLAGCTALQGGETDERPTASTDGDAGASPAETPTPADDSGGPRELGETVRVEGAGAVTVQSATVQRSIIDHHTWRELREPDDGQVLVLRVDGRVDSDSSTAFVPRFDGVTVDDSAALPLYGSSDYVAVSVPVRSVTTAAVVLRTGDRPAWELPPSVRTRLAAAPEFHLHDATLRVVDGRTVLDLTVENRGGRGGTFRGIVVSAVAADAGASVRFGVPAGETVTETVRDDVVENWEADAAFEHDVTPDTRRFAVEYP